jgi:hypothetical protein
MNACVVTFSQAGIDPNFLLFEKRKSYHFDALNAKQNNVSRIRKHSRNV